MQYLSYRVRDELGINLYKSLDDIGRRLVDSNKDVTISFAPYDDTIGCIVRRDVDDEGWIFLNSNLSENEQRFMLAHGLYYLKYQKEVSNIICRYDLSGQGIVSGKEANQFAIELLLPLPGVFYRLDREEEDQEVSQDDILGLAGHFGVEPTLVLVRMVQLGLMSQSQVNAIDVSGFVVQSSFRHIMGDMFIEKGESFVAGNLVRRIIELESLGELVKWVSLEPYVSERLKKYI